MDSIFREAFEYYKQKQEKKIQLISDTLEDMTKELIDVKRCIYK